MPNDDPAWDELVSQILSPLPSPSLPFPPFPSPLPSPLLPGSTHQLIAQRPQRRRKRPAQLCKLPQQLAAHRRLQPHGLLLAGVA
eukprot:354084-Chlamydomonas_euryale.AAC.7